MSENVVKTTCCVVGGGPAGVMLGFLLARKGVQVTVLEKHKDFFRDFRGDTVHPSTLEILYELGLLQKFLRMPHEELTRVGGTFGDFPFIAVDFHYLPTHCKFVALMPQWDFLDFLSTEAKKFPTFELRIEHEAVNLVNESGVVRGVQAKTSGGTMEIRADLVVGCDGRHSITRQLAQLPLQEFGVPIDVLWFRISRKPDEPDQLLGNINYGRALILINRSTYFQAGLLIRKDSFDEIKQQGLDQFRSIVAKLAPYVADRVSELQDWEQIKLLFVQINRLQEWSRPGLLCIGDAAHAMSPAGGVGINLAIQDAVATANILADALREHRVTSELLREVQGRREFPTQVIQFFQKNAHRAFSWIFQNPGPVVAPSALRIVAGIPITKHVVARVIGMGVRPEHVVPKRCDLTRFSKAAIGIGIVAGFLSVWSMRRSGRAA